jgi:nicotinate dehydrogenase subunit B
VTTIEGLAAGGLLHPVQRAFLEEGAFQCGYCTPGMVLAAVALLEHHPDPSPGEIAAALEGNICRCCAYPAIVRAVQRASLLERAEPPLSLPPPELARPARPWSSLPAGERDFFAVLPDGLVALAAAARPEPAGGWATCSEAWLHLGADASVTGFSGKVDVGQGNGGAFAALIAEELRLPLEAVRLVLGDTDLCPYDLGTFGSRSMPDAAPLLARAAAAARVALLELASERLGVATELLEVADGAIRSADGRQTGYPELLRGQRRLVIASGEARTPAAEWRLAGTPFRRRDRTGLVTGMVRFPSDLTLPGALAGAVLKPPTVGALLRSAAAQTGASVLSEGGFVGAVAPDDAAARSLLEDVEAQWERQPQPRESELAAYLRAHPVEETGWGEPVSFEHGDVERAFTAAPIRLEHTYTTAYIAHAPLESAAALAAWDGERLTVWVGTQRPFAVREQLAAELGLDEDDIRVIAPTAGGAFGGKHTAQAAVEAARLARSRGRPVKVRWSHGDQFRYGYARPAAVIDVRSAASEDGVLLAWDFLNVNAGPAGIASPYRCGAVRIRHQPADSPLPQGSYRALAATANHFARESHLDELAGRVGVDAVEFRLRHLEDERLAAVLSTAAERAGWSGRASGVGIAAGVEKEARVATCAEVRIEAGEIAVTRIVTVLDCGAVVDPANLVSQVEGATLMGLGGALFESLHFDGGEISNASLANYRVPRFRDVPKIDVVLLNQPDIAPTGAGETPIVAVAPAIANAVYAATGERLRSLPLEAR